MDKQITFHICNYTRVILSILHIKVFRSPTAYVKNIIKPFVAPEEATYDEFPPVRA